MNDEPLKIGIVGCSEGTHGKVWGELLASPEGAVYGMRPTKVWDAYPDAAQALANATGAEVVRNPAMTGEGTDGVMITELMPYRYLELARPLLQKGLRVFLNRPFAGSIEDGWEIMRLAERYDARVYSASALFHTLEADRAREEIQRIKPLRLFNVTGPSDHVMFYLPHVIAVAVSVLGPGVARIRSVSLHTRPEDPQHITAPAVIHVEYADDAPIGPAHGTLQMIGPNASWYGFSMSMFGAHGEAQAIRFEVTYEHLLHTMARFFRTGEEPIPREVIMEKTCILYGARASAMKHGAVVDVKALLKSEGR